VNGRLLDLKFASGLEAAAYHFRSILGEQNSQFNGVIGGTPAKDVLARVQRADLDITVAAPLAAAVPARCEPRRPRS
jgi:hypothetical protein